MLCAYDNADFILGFFKSLVMMANFVITSVHLPAVGERLNNNVTLFVSHS